MKIKNPGRRFSFLNAPGDVGKTYHEDKSFFKSPLNLDDAEILNNLEVIGQLWVSIRVFELTLRNFIHQAMINYSHDPYWWRNRNLINTYHIPRFEKAKNVEGLTFSSLTLLFSTSYRGLWSQVFQKRLQSSDELNRKNIHMELEYIRKFRNIVAHHEPIRKKSSNRALEYMHSLLVLIDPKSAEWFFMMKEHIDTNLRELPN